MDSFSFMIIDQANIVSVYETVPYKLPHHQFKHIDPVEILSIVQNNNLRSNRFEKVKIALDHDTFTFVPSPLYLAKSWHEYLTFVHLGLKKDDVVASAATQDSMCVYTYPLAIRKLLSTLYPTSQVQHLSESLIAFLQKEVSEDATLFAIVHGHELYILVFEEHQLTLVNKYQAVTGKDRLYYIMLVCKHRGMNPRKVQVRLTGSRIFVEELKAELGRYFIHVYLIEWRNGWRLPLSVKNPMDLFEFYCIHHADN